MLAISWVNRGSAGNDSDGFASAFGPNAELARNDAQGALDLWSRVITNFNQSGGGNQLDVTINMPATGTGFGGTGSVDTLVGNKPRTGTITLSRGNDANGDNIGDGKDWFLDPTPLDNSEYNNGAIINPFAAEPNPGSGIVADFMSLITVEMAHILGMSNRTGLAWRNNPFVTNTNQPDVRDSPGTLWTFDGPTISGLLTSNNGGGGGTDTGLPVHVAYEPNIYFGATKAYSGVADVGTAGGDAGIRYLPSKLMAHMLSDVYGYTINEPARFGTFHAMLQSDGQLRIRGGLPAGLGFPSNDSIKVFASGANIEIELDLGNEVAGTGISGPQDSGFLIPSVTSIRIDAGDGNDFILLGSMQSNIPVTVIGGTGTNTLEMNGTSGNDTLTVANSSVTSTSINVTSYSGIDSLVWLPQLGTADVFAPAAVLAPLRIDMTSGAGALNIHTLGQYSDMTINGSDGQDLINIAPNAGTDSIQADISINGGLDSDTLTLGQNSLDPITGTISFDGTAGLNDRVILNDQTPASPFYYNISKTSVQRDGLFGGLAYSNLDRIILYSGTGDNTVSVFVGVIAPVEVHDSGGFDTLTVNDSTGSTGRIWNINPDQVIVDGALTATDGFEGVGILAGSGADQITFSAGLTQSFNVDAGGGNDAITIGYLSQAVFASTRPTIINGGAGNDTFAWNRGSNNWGELIYGDFTDPVTLDGGSGYNTLSVDDTTRGNTSYQFYADRFYSYEPAVFPAGADFSYDNMSAIGITCSNGNNPFAVYGTSSDIAAGNQITVVLNGGNDTAVMVPHDPSGNLTINGTIGIIGGTGTDTMTFDDTGAANPVNYSFSNPFGAGTQDVFGMGAAGMGYTNDFEGATIKGGNGDDTFSINQYKAGTGLAIYGGGGNDTLNFGNGNLASNVTSIASFLFDGQAGSNTFNLLSVSDSTGSYARNVGSVSYSNGAGTYGITLSEANTQSMHVYPSSNAPTVSMVGVAPGTTTVVHFNTPVNLGVMQFGVGSKKVLGIQGAVIFDGGVYGGSISILDSLDTVGRTVHVTQNSVGAFQGDDLFPAGGSLTFTNINAGANPALSLFLGSGADTLYVQPNLSGAITVSGGNPSSAPGDTLNLALAAAQGYVLNGTAASGNVTSTNLKTLTYSGFENGPNIDDVAPALAAANINVDGAAAAPALRAVSSSFGPSGTGPTLDLQFSEDVAVLLGTASIQLTNLSTGQIVPQAYLDMTYDPATHIAHFTFPGYPNGTMPDGNYRGSVLANSTDDQFGNALGSDTPFDFFILGGDANHDRTVDINDLYALASNWHGTGALYSQGDFNYDGAVDAKDLGILATHWQQFLDAPPSAAPVTLHRIPARKPTRLVSVVS